MTIKILHLYYDLMNLYGESGNIKAIKYFLNEQKIDVQIDRLSIEDKINFNKYDFIYIGSGKEQDQLYALDNIKKYKDELIEYIENNKFILATGNSFELFGKMIEDNEALGILNFKTKYLSKRKVGDYRKDDILAFENHGSKIINNNNPLFDENIGVKYNNFYGTYLIGPLLVRNPNLNKKIMKDLILSKDKNFEFKDVDLSFDEDAYNSYLETYC